MARFLKQGFFFVPGLLILVFVLSSCGSTSSTQTGSTGTTTQASGTTATQDTSSDYGKSYPNTTPTVAPTTPTTGIMVKTTSATVSGKAVTILTNAKGLTLYYFKPDTATKTACIADCASTWPPLLNSGGNPQSEAKLPGELEVYPNTNGKQIVYNDHPLYTFSGDTAPGQINGEGIGGKWFVVTPDLAKNNA